MSSKAAKSSRSAQVETNNNDLLLPALDDTPTSADVSDVESFSRTVPDLDDDEELDMPSSGPSRIYTPVGGIETPPQVTIEAADDDESTVRTHGEAIQEADLSVNVWQWYCV
jgi:hypothetical protein